MIAAYADRLRRDGDARKLLIVAIATTASGAEATPSLGIRTRDGRKLLFSDIKLAARLILLDPDANIAVPTSIMLATGIKASHTASKGCTRRCVRR